MRLLNGNILTEGVEEEKGMFEMNVAKPYRVLKVIQTPDDMKGLAAGDIVYIPKKSGTVIEIDGKNYITIHEREIILIL